MFVMLKVFSSIMCMFLLSGCVVKLDSSNPPSNVALMDKAVVMSSHIQPSYPILPQDSNDRNVQLIEKLELDFKYHSKVVLSKCKDFSFDEAMLNQMTIISKTIDSNSKDIDLRGCVYNQNLLLLEVKSQNNILTRGSLALSKCNQTNAETIMEIHTDNYHFEGNFCLVKDQTISIDLSLNIDKDMPLAH